MFEGRRIGSWWVLGFEFTKSQPFSSLTNDSQANFYCLLLKDHTSAQRPANKQLTRREASKRAISAQLTGNSL